MGSSCLKSHGVFEGPPREEVKNLHLLTDVMPMTQRYKFATQKSDPETQMENMAPLSPSTSGWEEEGWEEAFLVTSPSALLCNPQRTQNLSQIHRGSSQDQL